MNKLTIAALNSAKHYVHVKRQSAADRKVVATEVLDDIARLSCLHHSGLVRRLLKREEATQVRKLKRLVDVDAQCDEALKELESLAQLACDEGPNELDE